MRKTDSCWLWTAACNDFGYGIFRVNGRNVRAHRFAYEQLVGVIPDGTELDHLCDTPACVNPEHLKAVTHQENVARALPGRRSWRAERTHCRNGHEFTETNIVTVRRAPEAGGDYRACRECKRQASARANAKRRA